MNANVALARPISSYSVMLAKNFVEMLSVFTPDKFYTKVINGENELYVSQFMLPEAGHKLALVITMLI